jgi:hypothetical protein
MYKDGTNDVCIYNNIRRLCVDVIAELITSIPAISGMERIAVQKVNVKVTLLMEILFIDFENYFSGG